VAALMRKICGVETPSDRSTATTMGPTTRDPLIMVLLSDTEPARSSRLTSVGSMADHAGALSAFPTPTPHATRKMAQILASALASGASMAEKNSCTNWVPMSQRRRSKRSAMTPAGIERNNNGPSWANTMRPTTEALPVRSSTYTGSTTFCIHVPMFELNDATHIRRNLG